MSDRSVYECSRWFHGSKKAATSIPDHATTLPPTATPDWSALERSERRCVLQIRSIFIETRRRVRESRSVAGSPAASRTQLAGKKGPCDPLGVDVMQLIVNLNPRDIRAAWKRAFESLGIGTLYWRCFLTVYLHIILVGWTVVTRLVGISLQC